MSTILSVSLCLIISISAFAAQQGYISTPDGAALISYSMIDGDPTMEGDMIIDPKERPSEIQIEGAGRWWRRRRWYNKTVPYVIDEKIPNKERILWAIDHYHKETQIRLVPRTNESSYVYFQHNGEEGGCNSPVGRIGGKQIIKIPDWCGQGSVVHEIAHSLGMVHEQTRRDRNKYLKIHWDNIEKGQTHNFWEFPFRNANYTDFDFNSIMLYGPFSFAADKTRPTITLLNGDVYPVQRDGLSVGDKETLAKMYGYFEVKK